MFEEEYEIFLLRKLCDARFVGVSKHFDMAVLFGKGHFTLESHCPSAAAIWTYLSSLYYFDHLNELNKPDLVYLFL